MLFQSQEPKSVSQSHEGDFFSLHKVLELILSRKKECPALKNNDYEEVYSEVPVPCQPEESDGAWGHDKTGNVLTGITTIWHVGTIKKSCTLKKVKTETSTNCGESITLTASDTYETGTEKKFEMSMGVSTVDFLSGFVSSSAVMSDTIYTNQVYDASTVLTSTYSPLRPPSMVEVEIWVVREQLIRVAAHEYSINSGGQKIDGGATGNVSTIAYDTKIKGYIQNEKCCQ